MDLTRARSSTWITCQPAPAASGSGGATKRSPVYRRHTPIFLSQNEAPPPQPPDGPVAAAVRGGGGGVGVELPPVGPIRVAVGGERPVVDGVGRRTPVVGRGRPVILDAAVEHLGRGGHADRARRPAGVVVDDVPAADLPAPGGRAAVRRGGVGLRVGPESEPYDAGLGGRGAD